MNLAVKINGLKKGFCSGSNKIEVIKSLDFSLEKGSFEIIMGQSGSGKSTLLHLIAGLLAPDDGQIIVGGNDISSLSDEKITIFRRKHIGLIFQDFNLLDTLTVSENIALALTINRVPVKQVDALVQKMAEKLNITDILEKYPYQISGGQKQRCACARALINNPKLILADEPTGALDSHSAKILLSTIRRINVEFGTTILMVTHDAYSASYASRILFLRDGAIFAEIQKENDTQQVFFDKILNVLTAMGGDACDVS